MSHATLAGMTESGKTYLGQTLAAHIKSQFPVLVLHKPREVWPEKSCTIQTDSPETFLKLYEEQTRVNNKFNKSAACFMELSDADVDKYDIRFHKLFTQGRHDGFSCFYMTQRAATVHPAIRENCQALYLFNCAPNAAKIWYEEFNDPLILTASRLPQYCFIHKPSRFAPAVVKRLNK